MARLRIESLWIYPLKSARGIAVDRADVTPRGLRYDRRFMVVDEQRKFLSQRSHPKMARIETAIDSRAGALYLSCEDFGRISLPLLPERGEMRHASVWGDVCEARIVAEARAWIRDVLDEKCDIVYQPDETIRPIDPNYGEGEVSFADGFPFLLTTTASRAELALRGADVPMNRFRPNLVVEDADAQLAPFDEDRWRVIAVGGARFGVVKPCSRCAIVTTDQKSGAVGKEPLATLATFRKAGSHVHFGQNLTYLGGASIAAGDRVTVESRAD